MGVYVPGGGATETFTTDLITSPTSQVADGARRDGLQHEKVCLCDNQVTEFCLWTSESKRRAVLSSTPLPPRTSSRPPRSRLAFSSHPPTTPWPQKPSSFGTSQLTLGNKCLLTITIAHVLARLSHPPSQLTRRVGLCHSLSPASASRSRAFPLPSSVHLLYCVATHIPLYA